MSPSLPAYGFADSPSIVPGPQRPTRRLGMVVSLELVGAAMPSRLSAFAGMLNESCAPLAPFTPRGDTEIAGLLSAGIDPIAVILSVMLRTGVPQARWAVVVGEAVISAERPGDFNGQALWRARALLEEGRAEDRRLAIETGDSIRDARLAVLAPWVGEWIANLSTARRAVLRLLLDQPRLGPAHAAVRLSQNDSTRISKQAISQFLRHPDTRRMRALIEIVRADATLSRPDNSPSAA